MSAASSGGSGRRASTTAAPSASKAAGAGASTTAGSGSGDAPEAPDWSSWWPRGHDHCVPLPFVGRYAEVVEVLALNLLNMANHDRSGSSAASPASGSGCGAPAAGAGAYASSGPAVSSGAAAAETPAWQPVTPLASQMDGMGKTALGRRLLQVLREPRGSAEEDARLAQRLAYELDCGPWREGVAHIPAALADPRPHGLVLRVLLTAFPAAEPMMLALHAGTAAGLRQPLHLRMLHDVVSRRFEEKESESLDKSLAFAVVQAARVQADPAAADFSEERKAIDAFEALPAADWHTAAGAVRQLMAESGGAPVVLVLDGMGDLPNIVHSKMSYSQSAEAKERMHSRSYGFGSGSSSCSGPDNGESYHQAVWSEFARILRELQCVPGCFVLCIGSNMPRSTVAQLERSQAIATRPIMLRPLADEDVLASITSMTFDDGPTMVQALRVREDLLPAVAVTAVRLTAGVPELVRELLLRRVRIACGGSAKRNDLTLTLPTATPADVNAAMATAASYVPHAFGIGGGNTKPRWARASYALGEYRDEHDASLRLLQLLARAQALGVTFTADDEVRVPRLKELTAAASKQLASTAAAAAAASAAAAARSRRWYTADIFDSDGDATGASHATKRRRPSKGAAGSSRGAGASAAIDDGDDDGESDDDFHDDLGTDYRRSSGSEGRKPARINLVDFATALGLLLVPAPGGRIAAAAGGMWLANAAGSSKPLPSQPYAALRLLEAMEQAAAYSGATVASTGAGRPAAGLLQELCLEAMAHKWAHTSGYFYGEKPRVGDALPVLRAAGSAVAGAVVSDFNITVLPASVPLPARASESADMTGERASGSAGAASATATPASATASAATKPILWRRAEALAPGSLAVAMPAASFTVTADTHAHAHSTVNLPVHLLLRVAEGAVAFSLHDSKPVSADSILRLLAQAGLRVDTAGESASAGGPKSEESAGESDGEPKPGRLGRSLSRVLIVMGAQLEEELRRAIGDHAAAVVRSQAVDASGGPAASPFTSGSATSSAAAAVGGPGSGPGSESVTVLAVCDWTHPPVAASQAAAAAPGSTSVAHVARRIASAVPAGVELIICNPHAAGGGPLGGMIGAATLQDIQRMLARRTASGTTTDSASAGAGAGGATSAAAAASASEAAAAAVPLTVKRLARWMMATVKQEAEAAAAAQAAKAKAKAEAKAAADAAAKAKEEEVAARRRAGHIDMDE